jgi:3-phosphoshikimate 1-carboxyvinyltransferase
MHERPIGDLVDALSQAGADIAYRGQRGFPQIAIGPRRGQGQPTVRVRGDVSSQFLSALLIAMGWRGEGTRIEVEGELISKPYVELTLGLMRRFGLEVARERWSAFTMQSRTGYVSPGRVDVEGDASSASYFLAAGALGGGPVRVEGVGSESLQGDVQFARVLERMGAKIAMGPTWIEASSGTKLAGIDFDANLIPDAAMTAAVLALFAEGRTTIRNIASWRVKETDRISAMATELRKFGATVDEGPDFIDIEPPLASHVSRLASPVVVDTYDDHRMAMCFSLAAFGPARVRIMDPKCVSKTFPTYFDEFRRLAR